MRGRRLRRPCRPIRRRAASGARTTAAEPGGSCRTSDRPDVLQQDPDRSSEPRNRLPGRRAVLQDHRRRQDVAAGPGHSPTAIIMRCGSIRANGHHLLLGNDGGLDVSYDQGETWEFINTCRLGQFYAISADMRKPVLRLRRPAGQRQLVRTECGTRTQQRHPELGLVPDRRRRRLLHGQRSDRLDDRLPGIAGRRDEPPRSGRGRSGEHPAEQVRAAPRAATRPTGARAGAGPREPGGSRAVGRGDADRQRRAAAPRPERPSASTGTRRSCCRRTTRPRCISAATGCSARTTAATRGRASPDLTRNIGRNDRPIMGVDGKAPMASKHDGAASYSNVVTISESPVVPGRRLGGHQRRQRAGQPRRRARRGRTSSTRSQGVPRGDARLARRGVALRRRHRLRHVRRRTAPTITSRMSS